MNKSILLLSLLFIGSLASIKAQSDSSNTIAQVRSFMQKGDYENAIIVLSSQLEKDPQNLQLSKELALCHYFRNDLARAEEIITPLLGRKNTDDQCFQIAGNVVLKRGRIGESEKLLRRGIKKFPKSGALYNDLAEILWQQQDFSAIHSWEKGIEKDPAYPANYLNAARYYYLTTDIIWGIIYCEIYINMEPNSKNNAETKRMLLEGYKKFFIAIKTRQNLTAINDFEKAWVKTMEKQQDIVSNGVTAENLYAVRSKFILNWTEEYGKKYPFYLFEVHHKMLEEGLFEAYHHWLLGPVENLAGFQQWTQTNSNDYQSLIRYLQSRNFRMPARQYYQK